MNTGTDNEIIIDMVSRDAEGQIIEHLRIHPDGREEKVV
jgi:hypothetical protein